MTMFGSSVEGNRTVCSKAERKRVCGDPDCAIRFPGVALAPQWVLCALAHRGPRGTTTGPCRGLVPELSQQLAARENVSLVSVLHRRSKAKGAGKKKEKKTRGEETDKTWDCRRHSLKLAHTKSQPLSIKRTAAVGGNIGRLFPNPCPLLSSSCTCIASCLFAALRRKLSAKNRHLPRRRRKLLIAAIGHPRTTNIFPLANRRQPPSARKGDIPYPLPNPLLPAAWHGTESPSPRGCARS